MKVFYIPYLCMFVIKDIAVMLAAFEGDNVRKQQVFSVASKPVHGAVVVIEGV